MEEEEWRMTGKSKQREIPSMKVDIYPSGVKLDLEFSEYFCNINVFFSENFWQSLMVSIFLHSRVIKSKRIRREVNSHTHSHTKSFAICILPLKTSRSNYWSEQWLGNSKSWVEEIKSIFNVEWLIYGNESISLFQIQDSPDHGEQ